MAKPTRFKNTMNQHRLNEEEAGYIKQAFEMRDKAIKDGLDQRDQFILSMVETIKALNQRVEDLESRYMEEKLLGKTE